MKFHYSLLAFSVVFLFMNPQSALGETKPCEIIRNDIQQKNSRLAEYVDALTKFNNRAEPEIANLLSAKIGKLRHDILQSEKELVACEGRGGPRTLEGIAPAKSEEDENATKTCSELRKKLVLLVKSVHSLRRRESSLLSEFTAAERKELLEASEELKNVREVLKRRCSAPPAPNFLRRQAKPPRGN